MSYLKDKIRMVNSLTGGAYGCIDDLRGYEACNKCPLGEVDEVDCVELECTYPEQAEKIVADWGKDHPAKTKKMQFLEMFPNARMSEITLYYLDSVICNHSHIHNCHRYSLYGDCSKCTDAYWNEEI